MPLFSRCMNSTVSGHFLVVLWLSSYLDGRLIKNRFNEGDNASDVRRYFFLSWFQCGP